MRALTALECITVSGGEGTELPPELGEEEGPRVKNNNGYGNGAEFGPPPGNSGAHNPQLLTWNSGPRGVR